MHNIRREARVLLVLLIVFIGTINAVNIKINGIRDDLEGIQLSSDVKVVPSPSPPSPQIELVYSMIDRMIGFQYLPYFQLTLANSTVDGVDEYFSIETQEFPITGEGLNLTYVYLTANTPVNLAQAFNYYMKYYALCSFTWTGDQCNLNGGALPSVPQPVFQPIASTFRYYMNVCTFGYSTVWWDWERWEREIDWMALNGYNLPLAFIGQEYVWYLVFSSLGVSADGLGQFFTGPAFLPWNRMGNVNQWGGVLDDDWISRQRDLQLQILQRMRAYGMTPVLPGFAGHVPLALQSLYPTANITQLGEWCDFNGTYYLDPADPLFANITRLFIETQTQIYGTDHYYNFDPFNELDPPSNDTVYLRNTSSLMYQHLTMVDPDAIWVLQGWFLVNDADFWQPNQTEAFLGGVPIGKLLILDLWADVAPAWNVTKYFYGHDWIWCMLHNFGGRTGMYGRIPFIATSPIVARSLSPGMKGTGLTPEAIEQNVIVYDLMSEMAWRSTPPNLTQWIDQYIARRYGKPMPTLAAAWMTMVGTVFNCSTGELGPPSSFVGLRPQLNFTNNLYYDASIINQVWQQYLAVTDSYVLNTATFSFDVAEITIQALSNLFMETELAMNAAFLANQTSLFEEYSSSCLNIITDMDTIAATQQMLLVGVWTSRARQWAANSTATAPYEYNARNQITLWGPPDSILHDYAYHLWSGLISDFYYVRWAYFIKQLDSSLSSGTVFNQTIFDNQLEQIEQLWNIDTYIYPTIPTGNAYKIAKYISGQMPAPMSSSSSSSKSDQYNEEEEEYRNNNNDNIGNNNNNNNVENNVNIIFELQI